MNSNSFKNKLPPNYSLINCIYIYIYSHSQTDCFVLSELISVARQARFLKLGLKPC